MERWWWCKGFKVSPRAASAAVGVWPILLEGLDLISVGQESRSTLAEASKDSANLTEEATILSSWVRPRTSSGRPSHLIAEGTLIASFSASSSSQSFFNPKVSLPGLSGDGDSVNFRPGRRLLGHQVDCAQVHEARHPKC